MRMLLPLTLLLTVACSGQVLAPGTRQLEEEVQELKARVLELQRKAAVSEIEMARLRQQLATLSLQSEAPAREATPPAPGGREEIVEPSPAPAVQAAGPIEEAELEPVAKAVTEVPQPASTAPELAAPELAAPEPAAPEPTASRPVTASEQRLYDHGYTLYHRQEYVDAEAAFQTFLDAYADSDLADNAQYWIGECRYARQDYRGALAAFRETVNRFPQGNKIPDALLKAGQTLEVLGDIKSARESYKEVQRRFPDSAAALVAAERLEDLSS